MVEKVDREIAKIDDKMRHMIGQMQGHMRRMFAQQAQSATYGGYRSGQTFVDGLTPALYVGAAFVAAGAVAALGIARKVRRPQEEEAPALDLPPAPAAPTATSG